MKCLKCNFETEQDFTFCPNCGGAAAPMANNVQQISCKSCGMTLENGTVFCPNCGTKQD